MTKIGFCIVFVLVLAICFLLVLIGIRIKPNFVKQEPKQDIVFLTFDQRVAHMKKCFDAAEKITTLAWGESTGSITIQLYLDTIDDLKERKGLIFRPLSEISSGGIKK